MVNPIAVMLWFSRLQSWSQDVSRHSFQSLGLGFECSSLGLGVEALGLETLSIGLGLSLDLGLGHQHQSATSTMFVPMSMDY